MRRSSAWVFVSATLLTLGWVACPSALAAATTPTSTKTAWIAQLFRKGSPTGGIPELSLSETRLPVSLMPDGRRLRPFVEIHGHLPTLVRPGWHLRHQGQPIPQSPQDPTEFTLFIYLNARVSRIDLSARGPAGEESTENIVIYAPQAREYRLGAPWGELSLSAGLAGLSYYQTGAGDFRSRTGIVGVNYVTPKGDYRLGGSVDFAMTLLTLSSSPINRGPQLIEAKLDATYLLSRNRRQPLQSQLLVGVSYLTMLSNGSPFGFANLLAPELGIRLERALGRAASVRTDFRYVPLGRILSLMEGGFNLNVGWSYRLRNFHRVTADLGLFQYSYRPESATTIRASLWSFRLGYTL